MKYTESHNILSSLKEYLDYVLIKDYQAYFNVTNKSLKKYSTKDERIKSLDIYGSQFQQICYFDELNGINDFIIKEDGSQKTLGEDGLKRDFQRGRIILDNNYTGGTFTFDGSIKEFCSYVTSDSEENLVFETKYETLHDLKTENYNNHPYGFLAPCYFLKINEDFNEKHCLGGQKKKNWKIRAIIIATEYLLIGASDCFSNLDCKCFPIIDCNDLPLDEYGSLKDLNWNYSDILSSSTDHAYIEKVLYTPVQPSQFTNNNKNLYLGFSDFYIKKLA